MVLGVLSSVIVTPIAVVLSPRIESAIVASSLSLPDIVAYVVPETLIVEKSWNVLSGIASNQIMSAALATNSPLASISVGKFSAEMTGYSLSQASVVPESKTASTSSDSSTAEISSLAIQGSIV
jgi:hypothetical protein